VTFAAENNAKIAQQAGLAEPATRGMGMGCKAAHAMLPQNAHGFHQIQTFNHRRRKTVPIDPRTPPQIRTGGGVIDQQSWTPKAAQLLTKPPRFSAFVTPSTATKRRGCGLR